MEKGLLRRKRETIYFVKYFDILVKLGYVRLCKVMLG